jgi:hypothetical protein
MMFSLQVQKSAKHYTEAAYDEITLLKQIRDGDPQARATRTAEFKKG